MAKRTRKANFESFESRTANSRYARITKDMISSPAWRELDIFAQVLYLHMKLKYTPGHEQNISFTYQEGQQLMSKKVFARSIDKLIEVGLIDLVEHWRYSQRPNVYGLSSRWHNYGEPGFKESKRVKLSSPNPTGRKHTKAYALHS
jgi:hypothetical protein